MEGAREKPREEPPQRRLEAGRARFADFRWREATGDVTEPQEEAAPGTGSAVHAHDLPQEELPVAPIGAGGGTHSKAGDTNPPEAETAETEGNADFSNWDALNNHGTEKGRRNSAAEYSEGDAEMCQARIAELENRLVEKQEAVERLTAQMDELQDQLTQHNNSMHLQETTVQEQNELIVRLSRCLQQAKGDRDELQEEALRVAAQIQDLQLQLHQSSKDKENLLAQMEEDMKGTVQELQKSINEKEQHIQRLQDLLTSERFGLSVMQQTLCLRDSEIAELKKEIVLSKVKEQQHIEELKTFHEKDLCRQLGNLRNELEKCYRREIAEARQLCEEEIILKYKNELEQLKKELFALNSEEHIQNLNGIIIDLNVRLQESKMNKENLKKRLENQQEDFQREKSEMETKYKDLIDSLKCQLSDAERQAKEAQRYKQEKESLNEEIQKLNSLIRKLNEKQVSEAEEDINVRQKCDGDIAFNKKLMKLREKQISSGVSQLQVAGLEEMWHKPQQSEGGEELEFQPDSSRDQLEEIKDSEITESNESSKGDNLSEGRLSELGLFSGDEGILAKYLISTGTPEESDVSSTWEGRAIEEGRCSTCGLDNSVLLEPSRGFISPPLNSSLDEGTCPSGLAQEAFEEVGAEGFVTFVSENSLQENKLRDHGDLRGGETMCSAERCAKLSEQLHQKSALKIPCQEAFQKWEKAMSELSHVQAKLEEERAARLSCEKRLLQRMEKEEELENKLVLLVKQQGEAGGQPQCTVEALTQVSNPSVWHEMVRDLQEERERLMVQLRAQEQLVRDVQEQKTASDSVSSEVQSLFGRQLAALQSQRDQVQSQLDAQKVKNQRIAELLGQKTVAEEMLLKEQELLKAEISNKEQNLALFLEEKAALGERLSEVEEDLVKAEKALAENAGIIGVLEKNIQELNAEIKNLRETQECERLGYEDRLNLSNQEIHKLTAEIKGKSLEYSEEKSQLTEEIACLQKARLELEARLQESLQAAQEAQAMMEKHQREELDKMATQHLAELTEVSLTHKREMEELNAEMKDKVEKQEKLEEKRKEEIAIIKKVHEREHDREISELAAKHQQEMEKLRAELREEQRHLLEELQQQMEATHKAEQEQAQLQAQILKRDWELESDTRLKNMCDELCEKHQTDLMQLQKSLEMDLEKVKAELGLLSVEHEQSKIKCVELERQHQLAIAKLQEQLQAEHNCALEEMKMKSQEKEQNLQKELDQLQVKHEQLKAQSQEEIRQLWAQLENTRANRQELSELKEQLLARASQVEEIECLKQEFEQQRQQRNREHEAQLEQLRLYFEEKLRVAEENYREELTLLYQRLQELKDCSLSELEMSSSVTVSEEAAEKERRVGLDQLNQLREQHQEELACLQLQLKEQHRHELDSLRSSLALQYKEELMKMKMDLSDKCVTEIEAMKRKHCLELEHLRAQLSEEHFKELTRLHLQSAHDAAQQVEVEVAERVSVVEEEHKARLSLLSSEKQHMAELSEEIRHLKKEILKQKEFSEQNEKHLREEMEKCCVRNVKENLWRFMEEHKALTQDFRTEQEILLQELKKKHVDELELQSQQLQEKHKQQILSLTADLQTKHQAEMETLKSTLERKQQIQLEGCAAELQTKHQAQMDELEAKHLSNLDSLESSYLSEIQNIRDEHSQALEKLQLQHREQLQEQDKMHQIRLAQEVEKLKFKHAEELQLSQNNLKIELATVHMEKLKAMALEAQEAHKLYASASASEVDSVRTTLLAQFEEVKLKQQLQFQEEIELLKCQSEVLLEQQITQLKDEFEAEKKASLHDKEQMLIQEREKAQAAHQKEQEILSVQLQEKTAMIIQLEKEVESLKQEIEETNSELETLLERRDRENQEGGNLVALLRSDIEQSKEERNNSKAKLSWLKLKVSNDAEELLDETLTEHNQLSPGAEEVSELSQHLCESVFVKPELACENEEIILKICHRLRMAVERLLELVTESTKQYYCMCIQDLMPGQILHLQLEKMHENHAQFEEEFSRRNEETAQVVSQHQELMECLSEESEAKNQLALELHKAEGLLKEVEFLSKEKLDLQCQAEKDHSNLRSQMKVLEVELEEQLHSNQDLATQLLEVADLKQQIQVLEKQLRNQRQFMDEQAVEREHERDDFQQEIQKLEEQLKLSSKCQPSGQPRECRVESLQAELREKMDDYNKLLLEKEQKHEEITARDKEIEKLVAQIQELKGSSAEVSKAVHGLEQQLQKMKKVETELKQIASLLDQLEQYKDNLSSKNEEIMQLNLQLEVQKSLSTSSISQLQAENAHLKEDLTKLHVKQSQDLGINDSSALSFPQALLEEKNQEIDHLNEQMKRLQQELENALENKVVEEQKSELEELRSLVEHLRVDQERLCKDKDEEVEQLHGVIEKLQKELVQFGPVCHEDSDNQDDFYQDALGKPVENLQNELKKGLVDCQSDPDPNRKNASLVSKVRELQGELELVSASRQALQQQLEEKEVQFKMEVEILQKKCQQLRESSEQCDAELRSLRVQHEALQEEFSLSQARLSQREVETKLTESRVQELEDTVREREAKILEKEMQMKGMADQREADSTELQYLTEKAAELQSELEKRDASQAQDVYSLQLEVSRLDFQVQALSRKEVAYLREIKELQGSTANLKGQIKAQMEELEALRSEREELLSQLKEQLSHEGTRFLKPFCQREGKGVALEKGMKELEALEANNDQLFPVLTSPTAKLEKDEVMFDLRTQNTNPKTQIKQSQENILLKELDMIHSSEEDQGLKKHCQQMLEVHQTPNSPKHNLDIDKDTSKDFQNLVVSMSSWGSPEIMRKQDNSLELQPVLHLTPFSEPENTDLEMLHTRSSLQGDNSVSLGYPHLDETGSGDAVVGGGRRSPAFSESTYSVDDDEDMQEKMLMREADNLPLTPSDLQDDVRSRASVISSTSSSLAAQLKQELQRSDHLSANAMACLHYQGVFPDIMESVKEREVLSPQLKTVLKMVYEESRKILALSEHPFGFRELKKVPQTQVVMEGWQKEGLALLDAIQSLRDYLGKVAERGDKETSGVAADWRGELLQAVQSVFEKERNVLQIDLKSHFSNPASGDASSLVEKLEYIMKQQEEQRQMVVEHLFSSDRNSLLWEIQDLRAQLRLTHLQNQEKLQQLQETLTKAEDHGNKQEHQLRRKVELLEYKLQQEKSIVSDLHSSLSEEQKRSSETCDLLNQEKATLKSALHDSEQENERLQKSLEELQSKINQLRFELEKKEKDLAAALEELQAEQLKESELRGWAEEQQRQHKKAEDEKTKAVEELQAALDVQVVQNRQLVVSLEHERTVAANLRKELQIEQSRCEALLSQEHTKLWELQKDLDAEKNRSLELLHSLNHERVLTEQLSMRVKGASCQHRESLLEQAFVQELQAQLEEERSRTRELAAVIEKMHQKAIQSQRQLEAEVQMCCEETQKEREVSDKLRATLESLQAQKQEVIHSLEVQKEREAKLKADWEQLQSLFRMLKEQDKNKKDEREREQRQQQQTEREKQQGWQRDQERMQNFEWQHQRDEQRIKELQEILAALEDRGRHLPTPNHQQELLCTSNKDGNARQAGTKETEKPHSQQQQQQQQLEKIRQQLLFVAVHLNEFIYKTLDKTVQDWSASNDEAVASLLQTLKELKSDLLSSASQIRSAGDGETVPELEREAWQRERHVLQSALKQAESQLAKANAEAENKPVVETSNPKLQRLYRKYIRAESFRKALVYQKKYLLLLLGGFQDCEQATLSLIARMGIFPSPAALQLSGARSRPFTRFRCAARAIIAISRLKFLVKKWNKVGRKSTQGETISHSVGGNTGTCLKKHIIVFSDVLNLKVAKSVNCATVRLWSRQRDGLMQVAPEWLLEMGIEILFGIAPEWLLEMGIEILFGIAPEWLMEMGIEILFGIAPEWLMEMGIALSVAPMKRVEEMTCW
ncbi:hypothetical protein WISP_13575 [Willisornis vidua]|uniref:Pericentrin/AKAP-450 centrosomal targeting domain-containing protein n=3 Tax=Thamnophilidae TaxID=81887 RepID=A0ABQ9DWU3_9PASS|nr:hypothetical protein WISP_13575 [Willisornis vidua]